MDEKSNESTEEEMTAAGKGESQIQKLVRGCRKEMRTHTTDTATRPSYDRRADSTVISCIISCCLQLALTTANAVVNGIRGGADTLATGQC